MQYLFSVLNQIWYWLGRISKYRKTMVLLVALLAFLSAFFVGLIRGIPPPSTHDEFSYLLAADTFCHARLTNPPHPMWKHFESFHIIQRPTYMSKYPPLQGFFLAIGQVFFGHPIYGVWLSMAIMCGAVCWMLQAWVSPRWAILGGLFTILHPYIGIESYWAQSYWGGAVSAFAGVLVFGSLRRIARKPNIFHSLIIGCGIVMLLNSRPFEGTITLLPVFSLLAFWAFRKNRQVRASFIRMTLLPLLIIGIITIIFMGYYNKRITGSIFVTPYQVYEKTYSSAPLFIWQKQRLQPMFHNKEMLRYDKDFSVAHYLHYCGDPGLLNAIKKIYGRMQKIYTLFSLDNILIIALFLGICLLLLGSKWIIFIYSSILIYFIAQFSLIWFFSHYLGPLIGLYIILIIQGLRVLFWMRIRNLYIGRLVVTLSFIYILFLFIYPVAKSMIKTEASAYKWHKERARLVDTFEKTGNKHLVIVRYSNNHSFHEEWVYNEADIDNAKVVWARELDEEQSHSLIEYFKDRQVWLLEVIKDDVKPDLVAYPVNMDN